MAIRNFCVAIAVCAFVLDTSALLIFRSQRSADNHSLAFTETTDQASTEVSCTFQRDYTPVLERKLDTCIVSQTLNSEEYALAPEVDNTIEKFLVNENKEMEYLPSNVGEKFPRLKVLQFWGCGLKVVREFYFKKMQNLRFLFLAANKITLIEKDAFKDLVSVEELWLSRNMIETLDENLFVSMVKLESLFMRSNNIKFLSPTTFKIPGGRPLYVDLKLNDCINNNYQPSDTDQLEADLRANCTL